MIDYVSIMKNKDEFNREKLNHHHRLPAEAVRGKRKNGP